MQKSRSIDGPFTTPVCQRDSFSALHGEEGRHVTPDGFVITAKDRFGSG